MMVMTGYGEAGNDDDGEAANDDDGEAGNDDEDANALQ